MKQEYLNEEKYQQANTKLKNISKLVLIIGILLGLSLITIGIIKSKSIEKDNQIKENEMRETAKQTIKTNEEKISQLEAEITDLKNQKAIIEQEIQQLNQEQSKIFAEDRGFSDRYYAKETEIHNKQTESSNIGDEIWDKEKEVSELKYQIEANDDEHIDSKVKFNQKSTMTSTPFYMFGIFIIFTSSMISGMIYFFTKRRQIMAYQAQQVMPIAQEGMEKMAPTLGKTASTIAKEMAPAYKDIAKEMAPAYKDIAKEISKGIKEGLKDDEENK